MSLEAAILANTAAVEALTVAILSGAGEKKGPGRPTGSGKAAAAAAGTAPAGSPAASPVVATVAAQPAAGAVAQISYKDLADALVPLAETKGRDVLVALLAEFGVGAAKDLKPEQYAAVKARGLALLNAGEAPAANSANGLL